MPAIRSPSTLVNSLPAIYQADPFVGQFLLAFEKVLLGRKDEVAFPNRGLEETIANIATYFDPYQTPEKFLTWLASWVALSLRADLPVAIQRDFIANVAQRYRLRGTKANLQELLRLFVRGTPEITEPGEDPHFFRVTIVLPEELRGRIQDLARQLEIARSIIELEKPAHTDYELIPIYPSTIQIGFISTIGIDTLLGNVPQAPQQSS